MVSETPAVAQLPKIDFTGLDPAKPGSEGWDAVRSEVMEALASYGSFEAVYPKVSPDLRRSLFESALKEVFALPLETKMKNVSDKPVHGYLGQIPYLSSYESLGIMDSHLPQGVHSFTTLMWPNGNPTFSETVHSFSNRMAELEEMVRRMVSESLGLEKYHRSQMDSTRFQLRVSEYGAPAEGEGEKKLGLVPHRDKNTLSIVCQNQIDGLEMETQDGVWIPAVPSSDSFIVIAGDALRAWTNGRVYSPLHRIVVGGSVTRYSTILFSIPHDDVVIRAPPEMVDAEHPALFKPYDYDSYMRFCVSEEGIKAKCQLDAFCGLMAEQQQQQA